MSSHTVGRPAGVRTAAILLGTVLLASVSLLVLLQRWPDTGAALATPARPVLYPIPSGTTTTTETASVTVTVATPASAVAPAWSGIVTGIEATPGQTVRQGQPLLTINGSTVDAAITATPFYRPLALSDTGPDVTQLRALLTQVGFPVPASGPVDATVAAAVAKWLGSSDSPGVVFNPDQVVWIPAPGQVVSSLTATVGAPAPAPGSPLISFSPVARSATVAGTAIPASVRSASVAIAGETYAVKGDSLQLGGGGQGLAAVAAQTQTAGQNTDNATPSASASSSNSTEVDGTLTLHWATPVVAIPTTSIVTRADGSLCVVIHDRPLRGVTVAVTTSQTATGLSEATGLSAGQSLVVNPLESSTDAPCRG